MTSRVLGGFASASHSRPNPLLQMLHHARKMPSPGTQHPPSLRAQRSNPRATVEAHGMHPIERLPKFYRQYTGATSEVWARGVGFRAYWCGGRLRSEEIRSKAGDDRPQHQPTDYIKLIYHSRSFDVEKVDSAYFVALFQIF